MRLLIVLAALILAAPAAALAVSGEVTLAWDSASNNQQSYVVGRCTVPGGIHPTADSCSNFLQVALPAYDASHIKFQGLLVGSRYCFTLAARNAVGTVPSDPPTAVCVTVPPTTDPLPATNFRVIAPSEPAP